ncbi:MAG TPA: molybdopterin-dependent oxidoreductase [Myxococcales bacterium]|nr:molybdopterin-dependent oxidoreductase [Myxococcales bacterium]
MTLSRRTVLGFALVPLACDSSKPHQGFLGLTERLNDRVQRGLFRPGKLAPEEPASAVTAEGEFPLYKVGDDYPEPPSAWSLRVHGLVKKPLVVSLADLRRMPVTQFRVRHHCVEGWSAVASFHGVRVSEIARLCGADPRARFVEFRSFERGQPSEDADPVPYYSSWDRESAEHPQTILAWGRNGSLMSQEEGAPLRLYSAVKLGYKMVKWVDEVVFQPVRTGGYWEDLGYEWFAGV